MNSQNAHLYLPLVQALAEGKSIEADVGPSGSPNWRSIDDFSFGLPPDRYRIKPLSFPPKPEGTEWHNPDGLTAEQVGDGWRLCVVGEIQSKGYQYYHKVNWISGVNTEWTCEACNPHMSVRVPISTPYPDGSCVKDGQLVKPWVPKFKVGDRVSIESTGGSIGFITEILPHGCYKIDRGAGHWSEEVVKAAPLPESEKRIPWDDTSDFPKVPSLWIRSKNDYRDCQVIGFAHPCAIIIATCGCTPVLQSIHLTQDGFKDMEWSENRETWQPCSKTA